MENEKLTEDLITLAKEHSLTVIEELGFTGPMYRLVSQQDAPQYMALVYGYRPEQLH